MEEDKVIYKELSYQIVGVMFSVYNELGYGYQEKIYQKAIAKYLKINNISFKEQVPFKIIVKDEVVGRYFLDFIIDSKIIVEIKKGNYFSRKNIEQVKGYLKASKLKLALLINFTSDGVKTFRLFNPDNVLNKFVNL